MAESICSAPSMKIIGVPRPGDALPEFAGAVATIRIAKKTITEDKRGLPIGAVRGVEITIQEDDGHTASFFGEPAQAIFWAEALLRFAREQQTLEEPVQHGGLIKDGD